MNNNTEPESWVVVTGCSSGIGDCVARGLQEKGYRVIATCRNTDDNPLLSQAGITTLTLDLADPESVQSALVEISSITGGAVYGLVNNGAYGQPGAVIDLEREVLREQFESNVFGTQQLTNGILGMMLEQDRGRVIQISSILGFICLKFRGAYNASKYALEALTDTMRLEHRDSGVCFSLIEPGPIRSRFRENAYRKFKQNIDPSNSVFRDTYQRVEQRLSDSGEARFTLPASAVLDCVIHALESKHPKIRYPVTIPTYVMAVFKRILPNRLMDRLLIANSDK